MDGVKTLATLVLGGAFDATELSDNDIVIDTKLADELQQRLVTGFDDVHIELVSRNDFDAALAREAALREELAIIKDECIDHVNLHKAWTKQRDDMQQRLTAAEQRNAILPEVYDLIDHISGDYTGETKRRIDAVLAALKPTESGASDRAIRDLANDIIDGALSGASE